jgi:hypothetical protein
MKIQIPVEGSRTVVEFEDINDDLYKLVLKSNGGNKFLDTDTDGNPVVSVVLAKADVKRLAKAS